MTDALVSQVRARAEHYTPQIVRFLRDMIAIPSESAEERAVIERVVEEMRALDFDEVRIDGLGNVLGRVGDGPRVIAFDGRCRHGGGRDVSTWTRRPLQG